MCGCVVTAVTGVWSAEFALTRATAQSAILESLSCWWSKWPLRSTPHTITTIASSLPTVPSDSEAILIDNAISILVLRNGCRIEVQLLSYVSVGDVSVACVWAADRQSMSDRWVATVGDWLAFASHITKSFNIFNSWTLKNILFIYKNRSKKNILCYRVF